MKASERRNVLANKALKDKSIGVDDICATLKTSKCTLYRYAAVERNGSPSAIKCQDNGDDITPSCTTGSATFSPKFDRKIVRGAAMPVAIKPVTWPRQASGRCAGLREERFAFLGCRSDNHAQGFQATVFSQGRSSNANDEKISSAASLCDLCSDTRAVGGDHGRGKD